MKASAPLALTLSLLLSSAVMADEPVPNDNLKLATGEPERCLGITRIRDTSILDERNILFYTSGKRVYLNDLPRPCPGLRRHDTLKYSTSLHELCSVDMFTVLHDTGSGFMPGVSCGFGQFYPISQEDAEKLKKESRK